VTERWPVTYRRKVRYSDSDAQGVVFNGNYLTYFDDTITDYFDALRPAWPAGHELLLVHVEIDFHAPARLGDVLVTGARVARVGTTTLIFELATWHEASEEPVASGTQVQVVADGATFRPTPVPEALVDAITALQGAPPQRGPAVTDATPR
jgi:acyl-CoA thioester hydrolase